MVARLLLDANQMKISKPGYDVTTAGIIGLNMDSASQGLGVHLSGTYNYNFATSNSPLYFPTAYAFVPLVFVAARKHDNSGLWVHQGWAHQNSATSSEPATQGIDKIVYNDRIIFVVDENNGGGITPVKYLVFNTPAG